MKSRYWPVGIFFLIAPVGVFAQVIFSEIMYDLPEPGGDVGREWIEIQNIGNTAVDMTGWRLFEADAHHNFVMVRGNGILPPGGFAVLADKPDKFLAEHADFSGTLFDSAFSLNNTNGEKLLLKDSTGIVVNELVYTPSWGAKGNGDSLQYFIDGWSAAFPTPGLANVKKPVQPVTPPVLEEETKVISRPEVLETKENSDSESLSLGVESASVPVRTVSSEEIKTETVPRFVWWVLLGLLVTVAGIAYWIGGRHTEDEFTVIEDTDTG